MLLKWISFSDKFLVIYVIGMIESDQESQTDDICNIAGKCVDNGNGVHFKFNFTLKRQVMLAGGFIGNLFPIVTLL